MANPSFTIEDEDLEAFDDAIFEAKVSGEVEKGASRSDVLRKLVNGWTEGRLVELDQDTADALDEELPEDVDREEFVTEAVRDALEEVSEGNSNRTAAPSAD